MGVRLVSGAPGGRAARSTERAPHYRGARWPLATLSPARRAAHAVVAAHPERGRVRRSGAARRGPRPRAARPRAGQAAGLRHGPAAPHARPRHRRATSIASSIRRVRAALQLGLFQLLFLDGVAAHAAIGEAVELAKPSPGHRLVNAVLRRVQREGVELPSDATPEGAAIRHSHPRWIVDLWWDWLGPDDDPRAAGGRQRARRARAARQRAGRLRPRRRPRAPRGRGDRRRRAVRRARPSRLRGGRVHAAVARQPARGARARARARRARARPVRGARAARRRTSRRSWRARARSWRSSATRSAPARCRRPPRACGPRTSRWSRPTPRTTTAPGRFDRVLLDPPCSGLGTLRSHPDLRWRTSPEAVERLAAEQDALLASARRALAPGGRARLLGLHALAARGAAA